MIYWRIKFSNIHLHPKWGDLPTIVTDPQLKTGYKVPIPVYNEAKAELMELMKREFPITNMKTMGLSLDILGNEDDDDEDFGESTLIRKGKPKLKLKLKFVFTSRSLKS